MKLFLLIFSWSFFGQAKVLSHDAIGARLHDYSFQEFCQGMQAKSTSLISVLNPAEIECFNQKFKIADFCIKKLPLETTFSRGFAVAEEKKIYCEEANSVSISLTCDSMKDLCKNPKKSCEYLKKIYAYKLSVSNAANIETKLNCYYTKNSTEDLDEL